jgi:hypothetical protein
MAKSRARTAPTIHGARRTADPAVERIAQLFDEIEDFLSVLRQQLGLWPAE